MPTSYKETAAIGVSGRALVQEITDAGRKARLDQPDAAARVVREILE